MAQRHVSKDWLKAHAILKDAVSQRFQELNGHAPPPEPLFHFTDSNGLIGILESKTLWLSLANALNDKSEIEYGRRLLDTVVGSLVLGESPLPLQLLAEALERQTWRVFVFSLCAQTDGALQWLHYGRSGSGFAIGFKPSLLSRHGCAVRPVEYRRTRQVELIRGVICGVNQAFLAAQSHLTPADNRDLLVRLAMDTMATLIWMILPRLKDPSFSAEEEWRLIAAVPMGEGVPKPELLGRTSFHSRAGRIVPYKALSYDALPVVEIVQGASAQSQDSPVALRVMLETCLPNGGEIGVTVSSVPVRP